MTTEEKKALLVLEDGSLFEGYSFGALGEVSGEAVFNTSLTGYQEIITDPSYRGQIVAMTYPHIGNYGINPHDHESRMPFLSALVVKEVCQTPRNYFLSDTLDSYLKTTGIIGIYNVETRRLTRRLREKGAMSAILSTTDLNPESLKEKVSRVKGLSGQDLVREVSCLESHVWQKREDKKQFKVMVYDFGVKSNILRMLADRNCTVEVVPAGTSAETALESGADGILLSNGPGDPEAVTYAIKTVEKLIGKIPLFGICLGHQILGLALGGKTYKLKFGHHGGNQPVMDLVTRKVEVTAQNHGFAVDEKTLPKGMEITHINLNDKTVEGMRHTKFPLFSVQYHPEASPGPHDSGYLFDRFIQNMKTFSPGRK